MSKPSKERLWLDLMCCLLLLAATFDHTLVVWSRLLFSWFSGLGFGFLLADVKDYLDKERARLEELERKS
jgi:hypothetical protein